MIDAERELRKMRGEVPHRPDLENRIRELEDEISYLRGFIKGMKESRALPVPAVSDPPFPGQIWRPGTTSAPQKISCETVSKVAPGVYLHAKDGYPTKWELRDVQEVTCITK